MTCLLNLNWGFFISMNKFVFLFFITISFSVIAAEPDKTIVRVAPAELEETTAIDKTDKTAETHSPLPPKKSNGVIIGKPAISVNTDNPLDMNWTGALELTDPALRPAAVELPFLPDYPIDNLEIKLHLLNVKF